VSIVRLPAVSNLTDPASLQGVTGAIVDLEQAPLPAAGLSGASLTRVAAHLQNGQRRHLMLKLVVPAESWTAFRSGDATGREALVLAEPALQRIWDGIACPYLAYAIEPGRIGLLMDDLSPWLLAPGLRLSMAQEDTFLHTLAAHHARFWQADALALPWLAPLPVRFSILGPGAGEEEQHRRPGHPLFEAVARGWELALAQTPSSARDLLLQPAEELAARHTGLPSTLLHGDAKAGNCAFLPGGGIALFDWATPGPGPATVDLYYFLAVDAAHHARPKDAIIAAYRRELETALGAPVSETLWERLQRAGAVAAARMLLWSKALALASGDPGAEAAWNWWLAALGG
jgi:hypothetical protein